MTVSACLWLGLFPLVQFGTYQSLTHDKWICMLILAGLTLVCFLTDILMRRVSSPRLLPLLLGAGLLLWTVVSCLASPYPGAPWWIGTGRREGLATQLCYFALFFMFAFSKVRRTPVLIASGCGVLLFAAVVLLQRSGGNPLGLYPDSYSFPISRARSAMWTCVPVIWSSSAAFFSLSWSKRCVPFSVLFRRLQRMACRPLVLHPGRCRKSGPENCPAG